MEVKAQQFTPGQNVTVLACDTLFVGVLLACGVELECDNGCGCNIAFGKSKHHDKDCDCDCYLVLQLTEDVLLGLAGPPGLQVTAFVEGQIVFINFCQICAIAPGFPPTKKGGGVAL